MAQGGSKESFNKKHNIVLKDFYKSQLPSILGHTVTVMAVVAAVLMLRSMDNKLFFWLAVGVLAFMLVLLIMRVIGTCYTAPLKYKEQVGAFSEGVQSELLHEYPNSKRVGTQRYMSSVMVFFCGRSIYVVQYKDITGAQPKGRDLLMYLKDSEEPLRIPCPAHGMSGIVYAFLRSKNPEIKIVGNADRKETTV